MGRKMLPLLGGVVAVIVVLGGCVAVPDETPAYYSDFGCYPGMTNYYYGPRCDYPFYGVGVFGHRFHHDHDHDFHHDHGLHHDHGHGSHGGSHFGGSHGGGGVILTK